MRLKKHILLLFLLFVTSLRGQELDDRMFSYSEFIEAVKEHHPLAYQAKLQRDRGIAMRLASRGGFDPVLMGEIKQKYFEGKNYYSYIHGGLKVPTWYGITLEAGYNNNEGEYLSNEAYTPKEGLLNAGVSINLGKGLLMDKRRAEFQKSKIYLDLTNQEQRLLMNDLFYSASEAYVNWYVAYLKVRVYNSALENAKITLAGIKESASLGDKPQVDTLKAFIQVQDRELKLEQSLLDLINKKNALDVYLWQDGFIPLEIDDRIEPFINGRLVDTTLTFNQSIDSLVAKHPEIIISEGKVDLAKIDLRLMRENLKPEIQLKYNALSATNELDQYDISNYTWGGSIKYPLFIRRARGEVKLAGLELNQNKAMLDAKRAEVRYKLIASENNISSTKQQNEMALKMVNSYASLFYAERTLFNTGESSMFLLNTRENQWIDAKVKQIEIEKTHLVNKLYFFYQTFGF